MNFKTKNRQLYNSISEAWPYMLGNNFHWGYFNSNEENLEKATYNLIEKMVSYGKVQHGNHVLDIGCGIGEPASYLANELNCQVLGISNSEKGIDMAVERFGNNSVQFSVADALDNKLPNNTFDIAWLLEMSHLIKDKEKLVEESLRVVKPGGRIVLCDLILLRSLSAKEIYSMSEELRLMEESFGKASLWTLMQYYQLFENNNISSIQLIDISENVIPTIEAWKQNCQLNKNKILEVLEESQLNNFLASCDILKRVYADGIWGYGIITGTKNKEA